MSTVPINPELIGFNQLMLNLKVSSISKKNLLLIQYKLNNNITKNL